MATAPPHAPNLPGGAESSAEEALVVSPHLPEGATINLTAPVARLPVELEEAVPVRDFRVRHLLAPETGQRMLSAGTAPGTPVVRRLADSLRRLIPPASAAALPVLLCPSPARYHVKRWLEPVMPRLAVVAASGIPKEIRLRPVGTVR
jgi:hypothetical protein